MHALEQAGYETVHEGIAQEPETPRGPTDLSGTEHGDYKHTLVFPRLTYASVSH